MTELATTSIAAWVTALSAITTIAINWYYRYKDMHYTKVSVTLEIIDTDIVARIWNCGNTDVLIEHIYIDKETSKSNLPDLVQIANNPGIDNIAMAKGKSYYLLIGNCPITDFEEGIRFKGTVEYREMQKKRHIREGFDLKMLGKEAKLHVLGNPCTERDALISISKSLKEISKK